MALPRLQPEEPAEEQQEGEEPEEHGGHRGGRGGPGRRTRDGELQPHGDGGGKGPHICFQKERGQNVRKGKYWYYLRLAGQYRCLYWKIPALNAQNRDERFKQKAKVTS